MFQLDDDFLAMVGLSTMPEASKQAFLDYAQEQLEIRLGEQMISAVGEEKAAEFEQLDESDTEAAQSWLTANYPNYMDDIRQVVNKLQEEIAANKDQILASLQI